MGMVPSMTKDLLSRALAYHAALPDRIREYLHGRGLSDEIIDLHRLGWNGKRITIPVFNRDGIVASFKLAKDPDDQTPSPKMVCSRGATLELYGWERVLAKPCRLIFCEGEFDRLVLESLGFAAVTSTGGAGSFRVEWVDDLASIPELYLCFDRDDAGRRGALQVGAVVPHARLVELLDDVGPGGDISDFFVRLGHTRDDFAHLLEAATPVPAPPPGLPVVPAQDSDVQLDAFHRRIFNIKSSVVISEVVSRYVSLRSGTDRASFRGRCPFHEDTDPSLMVYPIAGTFRCFGCGLHGDVITFMMAIEQLPFMRALEALENFDSQNHGARSAQL